MGDPRTRSSHVNKAVSMYFLQLPYLDIYTTVGRGCDDCVSTYYSDSPACRQTASTPAWVSAGMHLLAAAF